jgi:hypothetical protein
MNQTIERITNPRNHKKKSAATPIPVPMSSPSSHA